MNCVFLIFTIASNTPASASNAQRFGVLTDAAGNVTIHGSPVSRGATVMPGDLITVGLRSAARLSLQPYSVIVLADTQVSLPMAGTSTGLELLRGALLLEEQTREPVRVRVPGAWVEIRGTNQAGALCKIASAGTSSRIDLQRGVAEIHGGGAPVFLHAGEWARLEVGTPPFGGLPGNAATQGGQASGNSDAGKVTKEIPRATVRRGGQDLPLNLNDSVGWNDQVHTIGSGRLQITLLDGSVLNVGSNSEMKIIRHDAQSQQTQLELAVGKMRADVQKITNGPGRFEVRTKTAVIGVVGTSFVANAEPTRTQVCGIEGDTEVKNADPAVAQTSVHLHAGECVTVRVGAPPGTPAPAPGDLASLVGQTEAGGSASAATPAAAGIAGGHSTAVIATVVALGAAGGTLGGLAAAGAFDSSQTPVSSSR